MSEHVPRIELAPGYSISRLIKGHWQLAGGHGPVNRGQALEDMARLVDAGITTFDCADIYTGVESLIGDFVRNRRQTKGAAGAESVQIHTKFVPDLDDLQTIGPAGVERAIDRSLARLGVERLDLVQFHWWDYGVPRYVDVAQALVRLQERGKIRCIGATNFDAPRLAELLDAGVPVVAHQVQYSVLDRRPERAVVNLCRDRAVQLLAYGALAGGLISNRYVGAPDLTPPFENRSLSKYRLIIEEFGGWAHFQRLLQALDAIARRHRVAIGSVALRWTLDRPGVAAVIVGSRNVSHLDATLEALELHLDAEDLARLETATAGARGPSGDVYALERTRGGPHAVIMRYNLNAAAAGNAERAASTVREERKGS